MSVMIAIILHCGAIAFVVGFIVGINTVLDGIEINKLNRRK